jgi:hypothetical protein
VKGDGARAGFGPLAKKIQIFQIYFFRFGFDQILAKLKGFGAVQDTGPSKYF